ncbi:TPA: hypothetical protein I7152_11070 [Vibrio vulnificus]|nr:hypothetical protein [Vibrio vulnificus]
MKYFFLIYILLFAKNCLANNVLAFSFVGYIPPLSTTTYEVDKEKTTVTKIRKNYEIHESVVKEMLSETSMITGIEKKDAHLIVYLSLYE